MPARLAPEMPLPSVALAEVSPPATRDPELTDSAASFPLPIDFLTTRARILAGRLTAAAERRAARKARHAA